MTVEEIIARKEGQTFDCKSIQIEPKTLAIPIVAMANADGGVLAIGVSDKTRRIEGVDGNEERLNELLRVPFDFCNPSVKVRCEYLPCTDSEGKENRILLFGKNPQRFFPRARTRFIRYEGTEEKVGTEMNVIKDVTFEGAILNQVRCTIDYLETQVREHTFLGQDGCFVTNRNYPKFAIQEMVVNSCCHRAYNIKGTEIQIKMFDDRLVFETPGDLPGLVRPDNIRHTHFSRNPKIAQYLKAYKYVKEFGEGIDRICNELETRGSAIPSFHINAFILKATLKAEWISEKELEQPETTQTEQDTTQTTTQNATQITTQNATQITAHKLTEVQQKIVNALISNPSASRKQLATLIGDITEDGIKYHLKKLQQTGVIARIGADNGGYWEVNQKVQQ